MPVVPLRQKIDAGSLVVTASNASALHHDRGPEPEQFVPTEAREAGASSGRRKRASARSYLALLIHALGGQVRVLDLDALAQQHLATAAKAPERA